MLFEYYSTSFICVIQIKLGKYFVKYDGIRLDNLFIVNYSYLCYRFIDIRDHAFVRLLYLRVLISFIQYIYKTSYITCIYTKHPNAFFNQFTIELQFRESDSTNVCH